MNIYIIRWKDKTNNTIHTSACSSYSKAQKVLDGLNKTSTYEPIANNEGNIISSHNTSNKQDVIDLINNLYGENGCLQSN